MAFPNSYRDMIAEIMANQDPKEPAFKNERECREWMAEKYPLLEKNFEAVRRMALAKLPLATPVKEEVRT